MKKIVMEITYGLCAGIVFLIFYLILDISLIFSIIIALLVYIGMNLLFTSGKKTLIVENTNLTIEEFERIIKDGKEKIEKIRDIGREIKNKDVSISIEKICKVMDAIFDNFEKNPNDIKLARKFLDYYLDTVKRIVELYYELSGKEVYTDKEREILEKAEGILNQIETIFQKQLGKLQEGDYLDLETELEVLETTMKMEGI